jgi:RNA polymerase sigma factor (sigma-70 family)
MERGVRRSRDCGAEIADVLAWQKRRDGAALDRVVRSVRHLAYAAAKRWTKDPERIEDLAQEGVIGIMRSIDAFDPAGGMRFSNHCWLAARRAVAETAPPVLAVIDVPEHVWRTLRSGSAGQRERDLLLAQLWGMLSIDAPMGAGSRTLAEAIPDGSPGADAVVEREAHSADVRSAIETALSGLPPEDAAVFRRRRLAEEPEPVEKIADDLSTTRDRIRRIEAKTVHFVRSALLLGGYAEVAA